MKNKFLKLLGTISAFFLSFFGLTGCSNDYQALYGIPPHIQQDLYGVPAPTQKLDKEDLDNRILDNLELKNNDSLDSASDSDL